MWGPGVGFCRQAHPAPGNTRRTSSKFVFPADIFVIDKKRASQD